MRTYAFYLPLPGLLLAWSFCLPFSSDAFGQGTELDSIIEELDLALDKFWTPQDDHDLDVFIAGVRHAARARLLLEQLLGEDIDDLSRESLPANSVAYRLRLIAKRAAELSGDVARELWRRDHDDLQTALLRLSELDAMVNSLKKTR